MSSQQGVTSSFCGDAGCIRVDLGDQVVALSGGVYDPATNSMVWPIADWEPFIKGVKTGEFDIAEVQTSITHMQAMPVSS